MRTSDLVHFCELLQLYYIATVFLFFVNNELGAVQRSSFQETSMQYFAYYRKFFLFYSKEQFCFGG